MNGTWKKAIAGGLLLSLLLAGCGGDPAAETPSESPSASESAAQSDAPTDFSKYNAYLRLADGLDEAMIILDTYFMNVEYTEEFALAEGGDYGAIEDAVSFYTANTYVAESALDYVGEEPAYARADDAVRAMGDSPAKLMEAVGRLSSYLSFSDYEEDNMAQAPEIHAAIWEPLQIVGTYYSEFLDALDELDKATREEGLAQLERDGEMILYHSSVMIYAGQDIMDDIWDQYTAAANAADPEAEFTLPQIDMTKVSPLYEQFCKAYEDLTADMADTEESEKVFTGVVAENAMKLYTGKMDTCYNYMGGLIQVLEANGDYTEAYDKASEGLSGLISGYNSIN